MPLEAKDLMTLANRVTALELLTTTLMRQILPQLVVGGDPVGNLEKVMMGPGLGEQLPEGVRKQLQSLFDMWKS